MINLSRQFDAVLPRATTLIVEIISHEADGTSVVELPNADQFAVRGTSIGVGDYAFIRDGAIIGPAPAAPALVTLEV